MSTFGKKRIGRQGRFFKSLRFRIMLILILIGIIPSVIATAAVVLPAFVVLLLMMALLKRLMQHPYLQAVLRGIRPCITGIILATGLFMLLQQSLGSVLHPSVDPTAVLMTAALAAVYFGSRRVMKKGLSPMALIALAALAGIAVYGL